MLRGAETPGRFVMRIHFDGDAVFRAEAVEPTFAVAAASHDALSATCGCAACAMPPNTQTWERPAAPEMATSATPDVPISPTLLAEVSYLSGVATNGSLTSASYWGFNGSTARKWMENASSSTLSGPAGVGGGTVSYFFDAGSNWSTSEKAAFIGGLKLWSAVADLQFGEATSAASADCLIVRGSGSDGAYCSTPTYSGSGSNLGRIAGVLAGSAYQSKIVINTSQPSWTNLDSFALKGGYGIATIVHEAGHLIGLGHGGPYNGSVNSAVDQQSVFDTRLWTTMSYIRPSDTSAKYFSSYPVTGTSWGSTSDGWSRSSSYTWMPVDILAAQQIYGKATSTPLGGGVVFGFNCNIPASSGIRNFFDFTVDTAPIVTLYSSGAGNTLDLSGYATRSVVDLRPGHFTSAAGLVNNIAIAFGTVIETAVGGGGADEITGNDAANTVTGGGGADVIYGGLGGDTLYGNQDNDVLYAGQGNDLAYGGQGDDVVFGNLGDDVLYGNLGNDVLNGGQGSNRLDGGDGTDIASYADAGLGVTVSLLLQGAAQATGVSSDTLVGIENLVGSAFADVLTGDTGANVISAGAGVDLVSGGVGADVVYGGAGADVLYGNQDNDVLYGGDDGDQLFGGQGDDVLYGDGGDNLLQPGVGVDRMYGGGGVDVFRFTGAADSPAAGPYDQVFGFETGKDRIDVRALHLGASDTFDVQTTAGVSYVRVNVGGDSTIDFVVAVVGSTPLTAADVIWS